MYIQILKSTARLQERDFRAVLKTVNKVSHIKVRLLWFEPELEFFNFRSKSSVLFSLFFSTKFCQGFFENGRKKLMFNFFLAIV